MLRHHGRRPGLIAVLAGRRCGSSPPCAVQLSGGRPGQAPGFTAHRRRTGSAIAAGVSWRWKIHVASAGRLETKVSCNNAGPLAALVAAMLMISTSSTGQNVNRRGFPRLFSCGPSIPALLRVAPPGSGGTRLVQFQGPALARGPDRPGAAWRCQALVLWLRGADARSVRRRTAQDARPAGPSSSAELRQLVRVIWRNCGRA